MYYSYGALDTSAPNGGIAKFEHDPVPDLKEAFDKCCPVDHNFQRLCRFFYQMSPSDDCSRYSASDEGKAGCGDIYACESTIFRGVAGSNFII